MIVVSFLQLLNMPEPAVPFSNSVPKLGVPSNVAEVISEELNAKELMERTVAGIVTLVISACCIELLPIAVTRLSIV